MSESTLIIPSSIIYSWS